MAAAPPPGGDEKYRYEITALNVLAGHGFSADWNPPYQPSEANVPLYPLFIATTYAVAGPRPWAVGVAQIAVDLLTCFLVAFVAFNLAPPKLSSSAATITFSLYAVVCWFTLAMTAHLLTETLAIFLTALTVAFAVAAVHRNKWFWLAVGAACGLAILTRPDSVLLLAAVLSFVVWRALRHGAWRKTAPIAAGLVMSAVALMLTPWTWRNFVVFGKFQPLASEYAFARGGYMPTGYLHWIRTWIVDETYFWEVFNQAFLPGLVPFDAGKLPDHIFDSPAERRRVTDLMERYNQTLLFTPEINDEFARIADERIKRAPLRFLAVLPIKRSASLWLTGFATRHPTKHVLLFRIASVLPIIIGGVLGFAFYARRAPLAPLLLFIILIRTCFLAYHYAPETRYIAEAYPPMIAACGVTFAAIWSRARGGQLFNRLSEGRGRK